MCGVAGALGPASADALQAPVRAMANAIAHRGPDDEGFWFAPDGQLGLAHRRLSIIDLSPLGHQPMQSASGNLVTVFNGEIYNHADIRAE
jgi:asparagine synthase (glutamine-hydrolysing)